MNYQWTDDSAIYQLREGETTEEMDSADKYIRARINGLSHANANTYSNGGKQR